ncbi:MAG: hypothetical protein ACXAC7_15260 [Candidatus Hodarchaeales archaeon]|jgi:hypothetical protein
MPEDKLLMDKFADLSPEELYGKTTPGMANMFFDREIKPLGIHFNDLMKWSTAFYFIFWIYMVWQIVRVPNPSDFIIYGFILEPVLAVLFIITRNSSPIQLSEDGILQKGKQVRWSSIAKLGYSTNKAKIIVHSNTGNAITFHLRMASDETKQLLADALERRSKEKGVAFSLN